MQIFNKVFFERNEYNESFLSKFFASLSDNLFWKSV